VVALERHVPVLPPGEGVVHLLVQLEDGAPAGALLELERNGFAARAAGPRGTWFISAPRERVAEILEPSWVKGVAVPPPAAKIAAPLRARLAAGGSGGEAPTVSVLFYKGVSSQVARATLAPYLRGALPEFVAGTSRMNVVLSPTVLEALAEEDAVFQIWPILPPLQTDNENSRRTSDVDLVVQAYVDVEGRGVRLGMWDGGEVRSTHEDLAGRVTQIDSPSAINNHSTHVAGTMISDAGAGNSFTLGMAPQATIWAFDFFDDVGEMDIHAGDLDGTNHSYGYITGWNFGYAGSGRWHWFANDDGATVDAAFGKYDYTAQDYDGLVATHDLPIFKSAGNDRDDTGVAAGVEHRHGTDTATAYTDLHLADHHKGGYDTMSWFSTAKNIITVGAVQDMTIDPIAPGFETLMGFSSWGPTDDGRLKPDVVANGESLISATSSSDTGFTVASGTSMSSPSAAGVFALLVDRARHGPRAGISLGAAEAKGLLAHGAVDGGEVGPDYRYGWGLVNAAGSIDLMDGEFGTRTRVRRDVITPARAVHLMTVHAGAGEAFKATLVWVDPPAAPNTAGNDDPTPVLVNDLDLRLVSPTSQVGHPWTLDPASPSSAAVRTTANHLDNIEQVLVDPGDAEAGDWTIRVGLAGVLTGAEQPYYLVVTFGCGPDDADCDGCPFDEVNDTDGDRICADWDGCPLDYNPLQRDRDASGVSDACDPDDTLIHGVVFDSPAGDMSWEAETGALSYNLYRRIETSPAPPDAGICFVPGISTASTTVTGAPSAAGEVWLLQVTGEFSGGEGPMGEGRDGEARFTALPCP
jgi:hypothetical protein